MYVNFRTFKSMTQSWDLLFKEAAQFATECAERLISISHSCDNSEGVVTVWYWDDQPKAD